MNVLAQPHLAQVTKSLKTSSAVAPSLLLTLICTPVGIAGATFSETPLSYVFVALAILPPLVSIFQILYFTVADRDRLQNEEHIERKMLIGRLHPQMGDENSIVEMNDDQILIENPSVKGRSDV